METQESRLVIGDGERSLALSDCHWIPQDGSATCAVVLEMPGLLASRRVQINFYYAVAAELCELFERMAAQWKGWQGRLTWSSADAVLQLGFTHNGISHSRMDVALREDPAFGWRITAEINIELGAIERLAAELRAFFDPAAG